MVVDRSVIPCLCVGALERSLKRQNSRRNGGCRLQGVGRDAPLPEDGFHQRRSVKISVPDSRPTLPAGKGNTDLR
jgi:hypothetical protein